MNSPTTAEVRALVIRHEAGEATLGRLVEELRGLLHRALEDERMAHERIRRRVATTAGAFEDLPWGSILIRVAAARAAETREQQLEEALRALTEALNLDCGDNSCRFARKRGGMRTNGGCRCIESRKPGVVPRIVAAHRAALALLDVDGEE